MRIVTYFCMDTIRVVPIQVGVSIIYTSTETFAHYTIICSYNMDSIPGECEALGLVVFSNIIHYLFIYY